MLKKTDRSALFRESSSGNRVLKIDSSGAFSNILLGLQKEYRNKLNERDSQKVDYIFTHLGFATHISVCIDLQRHYKKKKGQLLIPQMLRKCRISIQKFPKWTAKNKNKKIYYCPGGSCHTISQHIPSCQTLSSMRELSANFLMTSVEAERVFSVLKFLKARHRAYSDGTVNYG